VPSGQSLNCRIVFCGHTGLRKRLVLERLQIAIRRARPDLKVHVMHPEDLVAMPHILASPDKLPTLWQRALQASLKEWEELKSKPDITLLSLHATFFYRGQVQSPFAWRGDGILPDPISVIRDRFQPNRIITLIDDVQAVRSRLPDYPFRLRDLLYWRDVEIMISDILAKETVPRDLRASPYFDDNIVFAVRNSLETATKLIIDPTAPRVYASFPIGGPRKVDDLDGREQIKQEIDFFRSYLANKFVIMDPLTIDEKPLEAAIERGNRESKDPIILSAEDQWAISAETSLIGEDRVRAEFGFSELAEVATGFSDEEKSEITRQIISRDFRLLRQSHGCIFYRPTYLKEASGHWSTGTRHEFQEVERLGLPYVVIRDKERDPNIVGHSFGPEIAQGHRIDSIGDLHIRKNQTSALELAVEKLIKMMNDAGKIDA
jgi:hypothetical protein